MKTIIRQLPPVVEDIEVVERKGVGHPDSLCDAAAEAASRALCRAYLDESGTIQHHNLDKALLVGGCARAYFGGGEVLEPMVVHIAGRAAEVGSTPGRARDIVVAAVRECLRETVHALDVDAHVRVEAWLRPGSTDLVDLFARRLANDTSAGAGYAPLSPTERAVLAASALLRAMSRDPASPAIGEDTKVMGVRHDKRLELTVACATVARHVSSIEHYASICADVASAVRAAAREALADSLEVDVVVNAADDLDRGCVYLTATGTSAEAGDDGQVGRGNRVNGLITPLRPMTLEAAAGKNPVTHVGKLYNLAAHAIAAEIVSAVPGITRAECLLVSRVGRPVDEPSLTGVRVAIHDGLALGAVQSRIEEVVSDGITQIPSMLERLVRGEIAVL